MLSAYFREKRCRIHSVRIHVNKHRIESNLFFLSFFRALPFQSIWHSREEKKLNKQELFKWKIFEQTRERKNKVTIASVLITKREKNDEKIKATHFTKSILLLSDQLSTSTFLVFFFFFSLKRKMISKEKKTWCFFFFFFSSSVLPLLIRIIWSLEIIHFFSHFY